MKSMITKTTYKIMVGKDCMGRTEDYEEAERFCSITRGARIKIETKWVKE